MPSAWARPPTTCAHSTRAPWRGRSPGCRPNERAPGTERTDAPAGRLRPADRLLRLLQAGGDRASRHPVRDEMLHGRGPDRDRGGDRDVPAGDADADAVDRADPRLRG